MNGAAVTFPRVEIAAGDGTHEWAWLPLETDADVRALLTHGPRAPLLAHRGTPWGWHWAGMALGWHGTGPGWHWAGMALGRDGTGTAWHWAGMALGRHGAGPARARRSLGTAARTCSCALLCLH